MLHFRSVVAILSLSVALGACACGTTKGTPDPTPAPLPDGVVAPTAEELDDARGKKGWGVIYLNGHATVVRWSDGDSFRFKSGEYDDNGVRLQRYNTLESFGPVHRWGTWTGQELYGIAKTSRFVASEKDWHCTTDGSRDGYGRVLVDCPDVAEHMVQQGHAHVFAIDTAADPDLLKLQATAQENGVGIWEKGVPSTIITSLHSYAEDFAKEKGIAYNRTVDTKTGSSILIEHSEVYATCQEICDGPKDDPVCMIYVPFKNRYRYKPDCLRAPKKKAAAPTPAETPEATPAE
ncbi:MAG TPA: thermonuclease family protein [Acidobacteria bacterium]|nr:thermonuclease family protein [Acidobacteriota bacterium]